MTKAKMKENFGKINREVGKEHIDNTYLEQLMNINAEYGDGHKWCSPDYCLIGIMQNCTERKIIDRALDVYRKYIAADAKWDMLTDTLLAVNNFE